MPVPEVNARVHTATARTQKGRTGGHHSRADIGDKHIFKFLSADRCDNAGSYKRALEQVRIVAGAREMIRLAGILADSDRESVWHEDVHVMYQNFTP
jgi:hypothetical protein